MSQITGGEFRYLRRLKTGEYEHKEASATLTFSTPEGENYEAIFDEAANQAVRQVEVRLGVAPVASRAVAPAAEPSQGTAAPVTPPATRGRKPAKPPVIDVSIGAEEISAQVEANRTAAAVEVATDPASVVVEERPNISVSPEDRQDPANPDPVSFDEFDTPLEMLVTDATLLDALTRKNAQLKNPTAIKTLVAKFVAPPLTYKSIGPEARQKFLDELAKLV